MATSRWELPPHYYFFAKKQHSCSLTVLRDLHLRYGHIQKLSSHKRPDCQEQLRLVFPLMVRWVFAGHKLNKQGCQHYS